MELMLTRQQLLTAETAVVGSLLIDPEHVLGTVMQELTPAHFLTPELRHIFEAIRGLWMKQTPVDPVTVLDVIGAGYAQTLREIMDATPTAANIAAHVKIVKRLSRTAQLKALFSEAAEADDPEELARIMERANTLLAERQDVRVVSLQQGLLDFYQRQQGTPIRYLSTGMRQVDTRTSAELGDYILIGGTPSSGKTAFALQIAQYMAGHGYRVGFFSLETSDRKLIDRAVAQSAAIRLQDIKRQNLQAEEWDRVTSYASRAGKINLDIVNAAGMTVADIQAHTMARRYDVIVIDYVQLLRGPGATRYEVVTNISLALHQMSQGCGVAVIGLAQLSRPDKALDKSKPPTMADFRESGQLEQDADIAMILRQEDDDKNRRRLWVVKNKDGDKGMVDLHFEAAEMRFSVYTAMEDALPGEETNSRGFRKPVAPPKREVDL